MAKQDSGEVKELFPIRKYVLGKFGFQVDFFKVCLKKANLIYAI